ncbi:MAG: phosphoribosylanthranilate isomerase [Hyphomicrobium sp.]|uniref:phosphoribosylanthranilate isomerase n=1 Tax=Hyphomicrobium sp. TaxID=82 RepID=UPI0013226F17|nr:phosphoribosylanthranilate isomerase [Hyphomicrobium sp.]KAB2938759.1 MAG: phosphoribosylanthranilate isomerase [Hyphomicrobium sp.]MBZ0212150.1 phosphoribosylanthranilate isomerase [Hyphomicrobium sp.]
MATEVKICGLRSEAALDAALAGGADYVGFVFYAPSPRNIAPNAARALADRARGRAKVVALFVDPDDELLASVIEAVSPDIIQLHGAESPARVSDIARRFGRPVLKAVSVADAKDVEAALAYAGHADRILFDAKLLEGAAGALPGGNGIAFDWQALAGLEGRIDFMLAGGLNPANVAEAIRCTGAHAVDVSSGVESRPGEKDPDLIRRFLQAAKTVKQSP